MNFESTARPSSSGRRPRLLSILELAAFAVAVLILLATAFNHQELAVKSENERLGDALSVAYLKNLFRTDPDNLGVRLRLAENEVYLGSMTNVPALVEPLVHSPDQDWRMQGQLVLYQYLTKQYELSDEDDPGREGLMKRRRAMLGLLARHSYPLTDTEYLADQASKLHEHAVALSLYRKIVESAGMSARWCANMATQALGDRDYEMSAYLYFAARDRESTLAGQREYFIAGIRALMADSRFKQAMRAADEHLGNLKNDPETLRFLVDAARAADDPERAARYVRQLLQVSSLERPYRWWQRLDLGFIATADAAPLAPEAHAPAMGRYDSGKYELAYKVFLESHNLAEAYSLADAAVRQDPENASWHRRLATVAEWVGKPQVALREWLWLMRRQKKGDDALMAVLRMAPQLDDYDAALEAWKQLATMRHLTNDQWRTVADLFEKTGQQASGIDYLEARYRKKRNPVLLEMSARLSERSGDDRHARSLYLRLLKIHGFRSVWVENAANLYLERGEYRKAYALLEKYVKHAGEKDVEYRKLMADLAWQLQDDAGAIKQYQELARNQNLPREDVTRMLELLGSTQQEEAARVAEAAYRKYGDRLMLLRALAIYAARHDLVAERRLLAEAEAGGKPEIIGDPHFILARARYFQASGDAEAARAGYRRAIAGAHGDPDVMNGVLWGLVEAHDEQDLRAVIRRIDARGDQTDPAYWGALAATYDVLGQPQRAVSYYSRQVGSHRHDFLWLVSYADALDHNRQASRALRVRRYAWARLRKRLGQKPVTVPLSPDMLAAAQLAVLNQPGDPSLSLVRSVLRQDRMVRRDLPPDPQFNELVLGWTLSTEQTFSAKAWLWQRYGKDLARPAWADAMIASQDQDTAHLGRLFMAQPDAIPPDARHDAALALGRPGEAQSIAFEALQADPDNEQDYDNFRSDALSAASRVGFQLRHEKLGPLQRNVQDITLDTALSDTFRLGLELEHMSLSDGVEPALFPFPTTERLAGISFENLSSLGETQLRLRRVNEFAGFNEIQVSHKANPRPNLTLKFSGELNAQADESNDLLVYGMRNGVSATVDYDFPSRAFLSVQPRYATYYTQRGASLGYGGVLSWEVGQHVSTLYPDLRVSLMGINEAFSTTQNAALPLPRNQSLTGACFGFAGNYREGYSRVWKPYFDACATHNTVSGRGYIGKAGLAGPVIGNDRLNLSLDQEQGGTRLPYGLQRIITCTYRYLF